MSNEERKQLIIEAIEESRENWDFDEEERLTILLNEI